MNKWRKRFRCRIYLMILVQNILCKLILVLCYFMAASPHKCLCRSHLQLAAMCIFREDLRIVNSCLLLPRGEITLSIVITTAMRSTIILRVISPFGKRRQLFTILMSSLKMHMAANCKCKRHKHLWGNAAIKLQSNNISLHKIFWTIIIREILLLKILLHSFTE